MGEKEKLCTHSTWIVHLNACLCGPRKRRRERGKVQLADHWRGSHTEGSGRAFLGNEEHNQHCLPLADSKGAACRQRWLQGRDRKKWAELVTCIEWGVNTKIAHTGFQTSDITIDFRWMRELHAAWTADNSLSDILKNRKFILSFCSDSRDNSNDTWVLVEIW